MANPPVWKNAKNLRLVVWADKHLIAHHRKSNRRSRSLSLAHARARVEKVDLLLIPPVQLACLSDSRMRLALVPDWSVPAKAEEQLMRSKFPQLAGGQQLS